MNPVRTLANRLLALGALGFFMSCAAAGALATNLFTISMNVLFASALGMGAGMALVGFVGWATAQRLSEEKP